MTLENGQKRVLRQRHIDPADWEVLLKDHHDPYLSWVEYLKNQETLLQNRNALGEKVRGAARGGKGLLAGLIRCGRCGKKMQVQYRGRSSRQSVVYYFCRASQHESIGKQNCSTFGGVTVEHAVVEAVLDALAPIRMEAMMDVEAQFDQRHAAKRQQIEFDLERACYEADLCQRQYQAVDPENRLVARRWRIAGIKPWRGWNNCKRDWPPLSQRNNHFLRTTEPSCRVWAAICNNCGTMRQHHLT
jgi:hypothetical protein